jgi:hypothetical protein
MATQNVKVDINIGATSDVKRYSPLRVLASKQGLVSERPENNQNVAAQALTNPNAVLPTIIERGDTFTCVVNESLQDVQPNELNYPRISYETHQLYTNQFGRGDYTMRYDNFNPQSHRMVSGILLT